MNTTTTDPTVRVIPKKKARTQKRTRRVPPYNVVLENDDHHSIEFVVTVLRKALGYAEQRAYQLTVHAHTNGRAIVWTGPKEVAELILRLLTAAGSELRIPCGAQAEAVVARLATLDEAQRRVFALQVAGVA